MLRYLLIVLILVMGASAPQAQDTRAVYLTPIDGAGTDANPHRSRCHGLAGAGNIDLRPWGFNRFLCASISLPADMTGVIVIGDSLMDSLSAPRRAALEAILGKTLDATTVDQALVEILIAKIRAGRDGKLKIYLGNSVPIYQQTAWIPSSIQDGGLVADAANALGSVLEPAVAWATILATETFSRSPDGNLDGCQASGCTHTWVEYFGTSWTVASSVAIATAGAAEVDDARLDSDLATDDMEVSATITAFVNTSEARCGVLGRKDSTATRTSYIAQGTMNSSPASDNWRLAKRVTGTFTSLALVSTSPAVNDKVTLRDDGTTHSLFVNNVRTVGPITDASITSNTRAGITFGANAATDSCSLDNVIAKDYSQASRGSILWYQ